MKVPNFEQAIIPKEKLTDYLLSQFHPVGRFKAVYFKQLGYTSEDWKNFEKDIRSLLENDVVNILETEFGTKFEVQGQLKGPYGTNATVVTVWVILKGEDFARFVTAYPGEK
jgi:hypothetical protein